MGCYYDYSRWCENYGYSYYYFNCCNVPLYRFWNAVVWIVLILMIVSLIA